MNKLIKSIFSSFRRNEFDVIDLYDTFSNLMGVLTGGTMLNFGYWDSKTRHPLQAQCNLTAILGKFAYLRGAKIVVDVGSGFSAPAFQWSTQYNLLKIICININIQQLQNAISNEQRVLKKKSNTITQDVGQNHSQTKSKSRSNNDKISYINSTSTKLPIKNNSVDRIISFESAQHFKPLIQFFRESNRILEQRGLLVLAMPVITDQLNSSSLSLFVKLGILTITWASEHYKLEYVKSMLRTCGFKLIEIEFIGSQVYKPLTRYYVENREVLKKKVVKEYSRILEMILYKSLLKMENVADNGIIDYVLIKAEKI
ncbi:MAG: methyltransferase domain-containing protein [Candidatus Nitrosocosmicus sp.]